MKMKNFFSKLKLTGKGFAAAVCVCLLAVGGAGIYSYTKVADRLNEQLISQNKNTSSDKAADKSSDDAQVNAEQTSVAKPEETTAAAEEAKDADVTVKSDAVYHRADVYSFNSESSEIVLSDTIENIEDNSFSYTMDPLTVYLFVFDGDSVIAEDDQTEGSDTTTVTTADVPEHVEVSGETRPNSDDPSQPDTTDMAETTTSVSVVGTDADGETITEVITESAATTVSDGDTAEEEDEEAEKKTVPKAAKVIIGVLVVAVFVIMLFILVSDNKTDKIDKH